MLCEKCHKREARIYYTEIIGGKKKEQYLCETCASQYTSFQIEKNGVDVNLSGLLGSILSSYYGEKAQVPENTEKTKACPSCGMTYEEVLKTGKLGCAECYHNFGEMIERTLRQIQGADSHIGKRPDSQPLTEAVEKPEPAEAETKLSQIEKLHFQLQQAIEKEEFEEAARLRDEIRGLTKEAAKDA